MGAYGEAKFRMVIGISIISLLVFVVFRSPRDSYKIIPILPNSVHKVISYNKTAALSGTTRKYKEIDGNTRTSIDTTLNGNLSAGTRVTPSRKSASKSVKVIENKIKTIRFLKGNVNSGFIWGNYERNFDKISPGECGYQCRVEATETLDTSNSDIAMFFVTNLQPSPPKRHKDQLWVLKAAEPQTFLNINNLKPWDGVFNYSVSFLRPLPHDANSTGYPLCKYSYSRRLRKRQQSLSRDFAKEKRNLLNSSANALWFVSNCGNRVYSGRIEYARELSKYINIDAFTRRSSCHSPLGSLRREGGEGRMEKYWFYLSFENCLCKDYITEKLWKILLDDRSLTIPIVMGGQSIDDYKIYAPPNSYIHVKNFTSPDDLARHLQFVTENNEAFNYYHRWRNEYEIVSEFHDLDNGCKTSFYCWLCRLAHERPKRIWKTFSTDFSQSDCINLSSKEKIGEFYDISV